MTYDPMNAMSELVLSRNCSVGRVLETRRTFHAASAASQSPPLRPTRGSGLGARVDVLLPGTGDGETPLDAAFGCAHAVATSVMIPSDRARTGAALVGRGNRCAGRYVGTMADSLLRVCRV